jgi:hypothetical protein
MLSGPVPVDRFGVFPGATNLGARADDSNKCLHGEHLDTAPIIGGRDWFLSQ